MKPLRLDKAFTQGYIQKVVVNNTKTATPPKNHAWLVLSGLIQHVTGTDTRLSVLTRRADMTVYSWRTTILSAEASRFYPLFNNEPIPDQTQFTWLIITDEEELQFLGHATGDVVLNVLEWHVL